VPFGMFCLCAILAGLLIAVIVGIFRILYFSERASQRLDDMYDLMKKQHDNP
jgi:uncharacterized integral membrane protein